jgi:hypothetical protein
VEFSLYDDMEVFMQEIEPYLKKHFAVGAVISNFR